jgi:hypothetical protein
MGHSRTRYQRLLRTVQVAQDTSQNSARSAARSATVSAAAALRRCTGSWGASFALLSFQIPFSLSLPPKAARKVSMQIER